MLALLREGAGTQDFAERWRAAALVYFHDLAPSVTREVREDDVEADLSGLCVKIKGEGYWVPSPPNAHGRRGRIPPRRMKVERFDAGALLGRARRR